MCFHTGNNTRADAAAYKTLLGKTVMTATSDFHQAQAVPDAASSHAPMRVLVDIVHPADVLFFKRPIDMLRARGDDVRILSRHKDVTCDLLDAFGFDHRPISRAGTGVLKLGLELAARDIAVLREIQRFRPQAMTGFGGVAIAHAGRLTGVPSVAFYDSENATLQTRITWPFIGHLYVPQAYAGTTPDGRTTRLAGTKELSFLHPSAFRPDRTAALAAGLDPDRDNFFVRVVAWRANHDVGKAGWSEELLRRTVSRLSAVGKVHLSSETPLPGDLTQYLYQGPKDQVHHLLAQCRLLVGESATMASEAAVLGTPAIYAGRDFPGYVRELEDAGLIRNIDGVTEQTLSSAIDAALAQPKAEVRAARDAYVAACPDWSQAVVDALDRHAAS